MVMNVLRSKKFARRVLLGLLILIIPAFVLWGVGSITQKPALIGQIGRQKIQADDFAKSVQAVKAQVLLSYYNNPDTMNKILQNRPLVNYMAWERLVLLNSARGKRIRVTDRDVMSFLSQHPLFQRGGVFDMQVYNYMLRNMLSIEPQQFEKLTKENLMVKRFRQNLFVNIGVSEEELLGSYKMANDKVDLSYILINKNNFAKEIKIDPEEIKSYYQENQEEFFSPVKVDIEYVEIPYGQDEEKDAIINKVKGLHLKLRKAPDTFKETAEENGLRYNKTGPFSREDIIPGVKSTKELHDVAFSLKEGEISPPVASGSEEVIYILHKKKHFPSELLDLEEVKEKIETSLINNKSIQIAEKKGAALYENITKTNMPLEEAAKLSGQEIQKAEGVDSRGYLQNIGPAESTVTRALKSGEGKTLPPATIREKGVILVRVDKITPADEAEFEKKKDVLRQNILTRKQMEAMDEWFRKNASKIKLKQSLSEL